jgi:hypothetical protein
MSKRPGITVSASMEADGGVSPNAYAPWISAEVRVFWPPLADRDAILDVLNKAVEMAMEKIDADGRFTTVVPPASIPGNPGPLVIAPDQIV